MRNDPYAPCLAVQRGGGGIDLQRLDVLKHFSGRAWGRRVRSPCTASKGEEEGCGHQLLTWPMGWVGLPPCVILICARVASVGGGGGVRVCPRVRLRVRLRVCLRVRLHVPVEQTA